MIPPMREKAILSFEDRTKPKDRYGNYPTTEQEVKANVMTTSRIVRNSDGTERQAEFDVYLPVIPLEFGQGIKVLDKFGEWHEAFILSIKDAENFASNRILYRRAFCAKA